MSFPRYPKYKDSRLEWVDAIPETWAPTRLRFLLREGYDGLKIGPFGSQLTSDMLEENGAYKVYGQENVIGNDFTCGNRYIGDAKFRELSVYEINPGDLLITMMGTSGRCDVAPHDIIQGIMDSHLLRMRVTSSIRPDFVRLLIDEAAYVGKQIQLAAKGSIMHGLNSSIVKNLLLFVPPGEEQVQILAFLGRETAKIDELVAEQQRLIELLKEKRQAVISHAVTKGLNSNASMKHSGIEWLGDVPKHWQVKRVKSVSTFITSGPRGWSERVGEAGPLFIQSGNLNDSLQVEFTEAKRVQVEEDAEAARTRLCGGDVVVCITGAKTGNVAVCASVPEPAYVNQHLCLVRPNREILPLFLGLGLKSRVGQTYFELAQYGLKQGLSLEDVKEAPVPVPPAAEQNQIAAFISDATAKFNTLTTEAQRAIDLLQERRTALISAAVTGQIDVSHLNHL